MAKFGPSAFFKHDHEITNVNEVDTSFGQKAADIISNKMGCWGFIIFQTVILWLWIWYNSSPNASDPYPYSFLNLVMGIVGLYTGPIIMMSQNMQERKDKLEVDNDYETDRKSEEEIRTIMEHQTHHDKLLSEILEKLNEKEKKIQD
jgi:uncharacterized membrane protein